MPYRNDDPPDWMQDAPCVTVLRETYVRVRKERLCCCCKRPITVGQKATKVVWIDDDVSPSKFHSNYYHFTCQEE